MDYAQLRNLLEPLVTGLKDAGTHTMLPTLCEELIRISLKKYE